MLTINHIDELRSKITHKEEIRESQIGEDLITFCYMIAGENTFNDEWARECRGIVFNRHGKVAARPLHKFFNVNERESTRVENLDWSKVTRVMEKRDGSMIHTVIQPQRSYPGLEPTSKVFLKSKKSSESDVAQAAQSWVFDQKFRHVIKLPSLSPDRLRTYESFINVMASLNCTAILEYTAPDARIVLYYPEPWLHLLHVRENESGRYWSLHELKSFVSVYELKLVDEVTEFWGATFDPKDERYFKIDALLEAAKTREGIEGWVIQFEDGEMVKLKTEWYLKRHRAMTFLRERDIAALVLVEQLDDLKSTLIGEDVDISEILAIEQRVIDNIRNLERSVKGIANLADFKMTRKDFVLKYREKAGLLFGLLMELYTGKEPNYKYFFEKNLFKQNFSLRQLNLIPSKAEAD